jgi:hypothetical protein
MPLVVTTFRVSAKAGAARAATARQVISFLMLVSTC